MKDMAGVHLRLYAPLGAAALCQCWLSRSMIDFCSLSMAVSESKWSCARCISSCFCAMRNCSSCCFLLRTSASLSMALRSPMAYHTTHSRRGEGGVRGR